MLPSVEILITIVEFLFNHETLDTESLFSFSDF
jgi:hypothetical protein